MIQPLLHMYDFYVEMFLYTKSRKKLAVQGSGLF